MPQQESAHIANDFPHQPWYHTTEETPRLMANPQPYLGDQNQEKDDHIDRVARNTWSVVDGLPGLEAGRYAPKETILSRHPHGGGIVGVLERKVNERRSCGVSFGVEVVCDIMVIGPVDVAHLVQSRRSTDRVVGVERL